MRIFNIRSDIITLIHVRSDEETDTRSQEPSYKVSSLDGDSLASTNPFSSAINSLNKVRAAFCCSLASLMFMSTFFKTT